MSKSERILINHLTDRRDVDMLNAFFCLYLSVDASGRSSYHRLLERVPRTQYPDTHQLPPQDQSGSLLQRSQSSLAISDPGDFGSVGFRKFSQQEIETACQTSRRVVDLVRSDQI